MILFFLMVTSQPHGTIPKPCNFLLTEFDRAHEKRLERFKRFLRETSEKQKKKIVEEVVRSYQGKK